MFEVNERFQSLMVRSLRGVPLTMDEREELVQFLNAADEAEERDRFNQGEDPYYW